MKRVKFHVAKVDKFNFTLAIYNEENKLIGRKDLKNVMQLKNEVNRILGIFTT